MVVSEFIAYFVHSLGKSKNLLQPRPVVIFLTKGAYMDLLNGAPYRFQKLRLDLFWESVGGLNEPRLHGSEF